jgi:magnesium-transporting ATPase (P-type)
MMETINLASLEAALTGEAVPIDKITTPIAVPASGEAKDVPLGDRKNMCYSATLVSSGSGKGLVIATGDYTQIGLINNMVQQTESRKTDVLEQIDQVSKYLAYFILAVGITTFFVAWLHSGQPPLDALSTALTCAVAMIPEGLEAIVTMVYGWAVTNMAKQNAIIRALPAVETLGSVTVICSDKTGTLTKNEMSVVAFVTSKARYKVDTNASSRVSSNFVRDDSYLTKRADHHTTNSAGDIVKDGPNSSEGRRNKKSDDYEFTVDNLEDANPEEVSPSSNEVGVAANGSSPDSAYVKSALACGVLCSKCVLGENGTRKNEIGNPTELSILRAAYFADVDVEGIKKESPVVAEVPFSSEYKFMATIHDPLPEIDGEGHDDDYVVYVKGAPDRMVKFCANQCSNGVTSGPVESIKEDYWLEQIAVLSSHGLRVLAMCRAFVPKSDIEAGAQLGQEFVNGRSERWLTLVGLCAIMDPPRPECVQAIKEAHGAGVRVAMITGDHKDTATAIGHMLGIVDEKYSEAVTGSELDNMTDDQLKEAVMKYNVFARASPENKIMIVKALQAVGQVCSMTGDGVNDAPALKAANMGVAMGIEGTDVAREAAEMILADDNFATIVTAVREGRVVWDNLRKVLLINTPVNNAQGLSVLFGMVCGLSYSPLTPIQVLYSNLICAVTLGFVCAVEPAEDGIMDAPPRRVGKRLIGRYLFLRIALGTILLTGFVVGSVFWSQSLGKTASQCRSQALSVLNLGACAVTVSARFTYNSSLHPRIFRDNKFCWYSILIVIVLQVAIIYIPGLNYYVFKMAAMDGDQWGITALFMILQFLGMEAEKAFRRYLKSKGADTDDRELTVIDKILADADKQGQTGSFRAETKHDIASFRSVELHR